MSPETSADFGAVAGAQRRMPVAMNSTGADLVSQVRRTEIRDGETVGVVFEPANESQHFAVMLGGSYGGIPEWPARRLAENGVTAFALGYFGAPGLPTALIEIPVEKLQQGIEIFRDRFAGGRDVGLLGFSKGAELALVLAAELGCHSPGGRRGAVECRLVRAETARSRLGSPFVPVELESERSSCALSARST